MEKKRVYELAKELGHDSKKIIDALAKLGVEVKNHMSTVEPEVAERVAATLRAPASSAAAAPAGRPATAGKASPARPAGGQATDAQRPAAAAAAATTTTTAIATPGAPPVQRLYNKVDLRKQEKAFRPLAQRPAAPGREAQRGGRSGSV
ncbi:MAG: translation initiation factor IF-2 N-terminal domain-containing protein, partial [Firmicutes bacterium]|nr:translation initiation factor IF-2 N-terminal domain-containing protein [Bacillota bacterium]